MKHYWKLWANRIESEYEDAIETAFGGTKPKTLLIKHSNTLAVLWTQTQLKKTNEKLNGCCYHCFSAAAIVSF